MRYGLTALMGLLALGGTQARALPGAENALGRRAADVNSHLTDRPIGDPRDQGLVKRVGAPPVRPPPVRPPPSRPPGGLSITRPRPGRPNTVEEPLTVAMAIERTETADTSDIVRTTPCRSAKRGLDLELAFETFDKRSGDEMALTWQQWQDVFDEVDQELAAEPAVWEQFKNQKIKIIFMGGISSIAFGARGPDGKTGDADFSYNTAVPQGLKDAMKRAVDRMIAKNPGKFELIRMRDGTERADPMNSQWDEHVSPAVRQTLTDESTKTNAIAWEGNYFSAEHGDWAMQFVSKMARIGEWRARTKEFKEKDQTDAKFFLQKAIEQDPTMAEINMAKFEELGSLIERDPDEVRPLAALAAKVIFGDDLVGVAQDVKDKVKAMGC